MTQTHIFLATAVIENITANVKNPDAGGDPMNLLLGK